MKEIPFYNIPEDTYALLQTVKSIANSVRDERNQVLHKVVLATEYQQTLEEFAQIVQLSRALVDSKLTGRQPQEAQRELEKRQRFLFGFRHFLTVLENLEQHLDPISRSLHEELHRKLVLQAGGILEEAVQRQEKIETILDSWQSLDDKWLQEESWFQELRLRLPDASNVSADKFYELDVTFNVSFPKQQQFAISIHDLFLSGIPSLKAADNKTLCSKSKLRATQFVPKVANNSYLKFY